MQSLTSCVGVSFWTLVNLCFLIASIFLMFFPFGVMQTIEITSNASWMDDYADEKDNWAFVPNCTDPRAYQPHFTSVQFVGVIYLFIVAGTNQMIAQVLPPGTPPAFRSILFFVTTVWFLLANIGVLVVANSCTDAVFSTDWLLTLVNILSALFLVAMVIGLAGTVVSPLSSFSMAFATVPQQRSSIRGSQVERSSVVHGSRSEMAAFR